MRIGRRRSRKRPYLRKKTVYGMRIIAPLKYGVRYFKIRDVGNITWTTANGFGYIVATDDPSAMTDWTSISALFDTYRVAAIKVQFIPNVPNDSQAAVRAIGNIDVFAPFYVWFDPDNTTIPVTTADTALQYESCKVFNAYRPFVYYHKVPKVSQFSTGIAVRNGWIDCGGAAPSCGIYGLFVGTGYTDNFKLGQFVRTIYLKAKDRR